PTPRPQVWKKCRRVCSKTGFMRGQSGLERAALIIAGNRPRRQRLASVSLLANPRASAVARNGGCQALPAVFVSRLQSLLTCGKSRLFAVFCLPRCARPNKVLINLSYLFGTPF